MSKLISQLALGGFAFFSLVLVCSNGGISDVCKAYAADGADMGITLENCRATLAKAGAAGGVESSMAAMAVMIGPLFHAWFLAAGLASLYCLAVCEPGTKEVAVAHLMHGIFMCVAGVMHARNAGLVPAVGFPLDPQINQSAKAILTPWAVMCTVIGSLCMVAFSLSAGNDAKSKTD